MHLYANTTFSVISYALHAPEKEKKKIKYKKKNKTKNAIEKKLYILLYENRKYQSKMCTSRSIDLCYKELALQKDLQKDQIRPGAQRYEHEAANGTDTHTHTQFKKN